MKSQHTIIYCYKICIKLVIILVKMLSNTSALSSRRSTIIRCMLHYDFPRIN